MIKNEGSNDKLINKFSCEDFHVNSTLIVMPGESAVFVNGGVIEQHLGMAYKLTTQNYPFIEIKKLF